MIIFDPDPEACASKVRDAVGLLAEAFRKKGATVDIIDYERTRSYVSVMNINLRCSPAEAERTARGLEIFAERSCGNAHSTLHNPFPAGLPDGEYGFNLMHIIDKPRLRKRPRAV